MSSNCIKFHQSYATNSLFFVHLVSDGQQTDTVVGFDLVCVVEDISRLRGRPTQHGQLVDGNDCVSLS